MTASNIGTLPLGAITLGSPPPGVTIGPTPLEQNPVWPTFLDVENDFVPYLNASNLTGLEAQIELAADFACTWVQNYLQRPIAPTAVTEYLDGDSGAGGSSLMLRYYPIISVDSVTEYWSVNGAHDLVEQTPTFQPSVDSYQVDYLTGRLVRTVPGFFPRAFFPGLQNVVVQYTAGYQNLPLDIKVATLEFAKYWFKQTFDPRTGSRSTYDSDGGTSELWPGVPNRVTDLLSPYRTFILR